MVVTELSKYYADQLVFADINAAIGKDEHIGLVGANGIGKTTLLRILAGIELADHGKITCGRNYKVGYLEQVLTETGLTLEAYLNKAFADLLQLKATMHSLEAELANPKIHSDLEQLEQTMAQYAQIQQQWENRGGYEYQVEIKSVATGLGLELDDLSKLMEHLSGGQQMRARIGRLLLEQPDLLLLDEPSNHLDAKALEWLEGYLASYPKALIVVSHDRYFLDRVVTKIWELVDGRLEQYKGNYTAYRASRALKQEQTAGAAKKQAAEIAKMEDFIRRFGAGTRSKQAKSLEKRLEKMERIQTSAQDEKLTFKFTPKRQPGVKIVTLEQISKRYDQPVLNNLSGQINRGDRIALLGPNGSGKSTLLKIIAGEIPYQGRLDWGVNIDVGYFDQHIEMDYDGTVLEELYETYRLDIGILRNVLARFLFTGDDVFKSVKVLSGGERNRLLLAKLFLANPNFMILDEPTNHLDIYAREALQEALLGFSGSILLVSHDRYLVDLLATRIWVLAEGRITEFDGNYEQYLEELKAQELTTRTEQAKETVRSEKKRRSSNKYKQQQLTQEQEKLESEISILEKEKAEIEVLLAAGDIYRDQQWSKEILTEHGQIKTQLTMLYNEWEAIIEALEDDE